MWAHSQTWIARFATENAFIVKTCWSLAICLALQHVLCYTVRQRYIQIKCMNKLTKIETDILAPLSLNAIRCAPTAIGLAAFIWILPVIAIITPGTLSADVESGHSVHSGECSIICGEARSSSHGGGQYPIRLAVPI